VLFSVYLGLSGGGYDIVVRSEIGLVIWWFVLLGVLVGALPHARIPRAGWMATGLLAGFLVWTWIGLSWTSSHELTLDEVCRLSTYLGCFLLALCALGPDTARSLVNGLGCGIAAVSLVAVLSKLTPGLFPADAAGNSFYATSRLSYPFNYSDGVGEYAALGLPLVLYMATGARTLLGRALGTAALQPVLLCLAMTVSRGGIFAAVVGVIAFLALVPDRIPRLPTFAITAVGIAVLMHALLDRAALRDSLSAAPAGERHSMLMILLVVLAATAALAGVLLVLGRRVERPRWLYVSRRGAQAIASAIVLIVVIVVIIGLAAGVAGKLWHDFKIWEPSTNSSQSNEYFRLFSLAGSHRYQYWQVAWKAFTGSPFHGIGPGTFQYYWNAHAGQYAEKILNAHSLWFETLAETGIVGWLLLAGFFAVTTIGGAVRALRTTGAERMLIATATAGVFAFCAAASFDWDWQIGVVPMVALLLAAVTLIPAHQPAGKPAASKPRASSPLRRWMHPRLLLAPAAVLAMILIAIPLAMTIEYRASENAFNAGHLKQALSDAKTAAAIEPGAASPYMQQALVLEQADDISGAARAIKQAIAREPSNFQPWLIAEVLATAQDHPRMALSDYQRAIRLFPNYAILYG
jgi:O-antigen ligase